MATTSTGSIKCKLQGIQKKVDIKNRVHHKEITAKQYFCVSFKYGYINLDTIFKLPATQQM